VQELNKFLLPHAWLLVPHVLRFAQDADSVTHMWYGKTYLDYLMQYVTMRFTYCRTQDDQEVIRQLHFAIGTAQLAPRSADTVQSQRIHVLYERMCALAPLPKPS
jgi:hypothetical protein